MDGWGGVLAGIVGDAVSEVPGFKSTGVKHDLVEVGDFFTEADGAYIDGDDAGMTVGGDFLLVRERAVVQVCVGVPLDLFPAIRAARRACSAAGYEDVEVFLSEDVVHVGGESSDGNRIGTMFEISGRKGVAV